MRTQIIITTAVLVLATALFTLSPTSSHAHLSRSPLFSASPFHALPKSDNDVIQSVFQGIFTQNNLAGPYMIKYCFDEPTSHHIVTFIGDSLEKAAKGSVTDLIKLIQLIKDFGNTIPPETIDCLGRSQQIYALGFKYNIDGSTDFQGLEIHVGEYVALHYLQVHRWAVDLNDKWRAQKYYEGGFAAAGYGHKLLALS